MLLSHLGSSFLAVKGIWVGVISLRMLTSASLSMGCVKWGSTNTGWHINVQHVKKIVHT